MTLWSYLTPLMVELGPRRTTTGGFVHREPPPHVPALVCWTCGYEPAERLKQGAKWGACPIPREVGKNPKRCWLNAGEPPGKAAS